MGFGLTNALFRHKAAALWVFCGIMLCGLTYLVVATPKYESVAQMIVRFGDRSIPEVGRTQVTELTPADRREIVLAHAAMLASHDLAQATIDAFGIDKVYPEIAADPPTRWTPMDEAVKQFKANLSVDVGVQDNVLTVSLRHPDKELVPQLVHKLIELYIARQTAIYQNPHHEFLAEQVKAANERLQNAQAELEKFKTQWHIADYDKEVQDLLDQRGDVDTNLQTAAASLAQAQHRQADLQRLIQNVPEKSPESASGEKYRGLDDAQTRLADLKTRQSQMLATYKQGSPAMAALDAQVATAAAEVRAMRHELEERSSTVPNPVYQTLQTDYLRTSADAQSFAEPVKVLTAQLAGIDKRLGELQGNRGLYNTLLREHEIAEETYKSLSTQSEDALVKDNLNLQRISPATVISEPTVPYKTARPRKLITALACLFAATILAIAMALLLESRNDRFASAEQVALILDLPVLASFERHRRRIPRELITYGSAE